MALLSSIERRGLRGRLVLVTIYAILVIGALTMVYPFLLMAVTATTSTADAREFRLPPRYWLSDEALFRKYLMDRAGTASDLAYDYGREDWFSISQVHEEDLRKALGIPATTRAAQAADYAEFASSLPTAMKKVNFVTQGLDQFTPLTLRPAYFAWIAAHFGGNLADANAAYQDTAISWSELGLPRTIEPGWNPEPLSPRQQDWDRFAAGLDPFVTSIPTLDQITFDLLREQYGGVKTLNQTEGTHYQSLFDIRWRDLDAAPFGTRIKDLALRGAIGVPYLRLQPSASERFEAFAARQFPGKSVPFTTRIPEETEARGVYFAFLRSSECLLEDIAALDADDLWRDFLKKKYGSLDALNAAWQTHLPSWEAVRLPAASVDAERFLRDKGKIFRRYLLGNFGVVLEKIAVNGRALFNTVLFIALAIGTALTVNPLAAYALSRFRLAHGQHILLFLLATMAFPGEVIMIPSFLMVKSFPLGPMIVAGAVLVFFFTARHFLLRRMPLFLAAFLGLILAGTAAWYLPPLLARLVGAEDMNVSLMNSFYALVLPGMANAFSIFLLKGFFDSLPAELYEAAVLDNAGEFRIFWSITLPLCKPILAVTALGAFTAAYGAFMFAFLTCQDPKMWTLMVFLFEFQQESSLPLGMASLVIAAIPTMLVFIFCQRIILQGIVIPSFK